MPEATGVTVVSEVVPGALDGERVDRAVALVGDLTRREATELVGAGAVSVDDRPVTAGSRKVRAGQRLRIEMPARAGPAALAGDVSVGFHVVYADQDLIVVDKPAGLVVHPGAGNREGTLVQGLLARFPDLADLAGPPAGAGAGQEGDRPGIVHRLDKGTSGLLVVARTPAAKRALSAGLRAHAIKRTYDTVVVGDLESDEGLIDAPLGRSARDPTRIAVSASGRVARTWYLVKERFPWPVPLTQLECRLETGRTHQIRVHLAAIGHPVLGDDRYGGERAGAPGGRRLLASGRPFLHARRLELVHPATGELVAFDSPLPAELARVLAGLQAHRVGA